MDYRPEGYRSITPYLVVDGADAALAFYREAFAAEELFRLPMAGKVGHAEFRVGDSILMISDEWPDMGILGPARRGGSTVGMVLYVPDADAAIERAVGAGATLERAAQDQPWGDRMGSVVDPFGHRWSLCTHFEDVDPEEIQRRMAQFPPE